VNESTRINQPGEAVHAPIQRLPITRVGVDLAKRVIQVHAVDAAGRVVTSRALPRDKFVVWCAAHKPSGVNLTCT
jgi:hypothetical protein